jgi:hypothetical protein
VDSPTFEVLKELAKEMTWNWTAQRPSGQTEFEYLKACLEKENKIDGVNAFIREIESYPKK